MLLARLSDTPDIPVDELNKSIELSAQDFVQPRIYIPLILACNEMVQQFMCRPANDPTKLDVLFEMKTSITFGNVGSERNRGPSDLLTQAVLLLLGKMCGEFIQISSDFSAHPPHIEIFE